MIDSNHRVADTAALLDDRLGARLQRDVPLAPLTTYRVGGRAALFVDAESVGDLADIARARATTGVPVLVIGRGSNMLVADAGFQGLVVSVARFAGDITFDIESSQVVSGGGVALPVLARRTAAASLTGFEWAVGVPGSVGGAVRMNAGGHGSDIAASLLDIDVFDFDVPGLDDCLTRTILATDIGLRFRASSLAPQVVVLSARLQLRPGNREDSEREISDIVRWRRDHQPGGQNCGSVFVNPVPGEVTAGGLIDSLGLRGVKVGSAWVSEKHANFIQAGDGGTAADVRATIELVRQRVAASTGYLLRSEVRLVGFDDADPLSFDDGALAP
ncbi:MAG TPA: UDP-N-acetylmuramate dehydrogenase [Ilumatobacter sp.]|nr:UDP-N-acetylmuramate dehydrogenase [Ilumatobacter sp.]